MSVEQIEDESQKQIDSKPAKTIDYYQYFDYALKVFVIFFLAYQYIALNELKIQNEALQQVIKNSNTKLALTMESVSNLEKTSNQIMVLDLGRFAQIENGAAKLDRATELSKELAKNGVITLMPQAVYSAPDSVNFSHRISTKDNTNE